MSRAQGARAIDRLLDSLSPLSLVLGKGGVGKTTCASGLAARIAERGERTLLVSTDPAGSLGTVLGLELVPSERRAIPGVPGCAVMQLDATIARARFLARWRDTIITIVDRGTYLDAEDIDGLVDAAFPGADEVFALLSLAELVRAHRASGERLVVDTAPTGHTLRLLALPETFGAMVGLLDSMQAKHRFMVSALTHRYRSDAADEFIAAMRSLIAELRISLGDPAQATAVLVTRAEPVVAEETRRYAAALQGLHIANAAVIVQALPRSIGKASRRAIDDLLDLSAPLFALPKLDSPPAGADAVKALAGRLREIPRGRKELLGSRAERWREVNGSVLPSLSGGSPRVAISLLRKLTISGGKGGVGKSTVSCALALAAASNQDSTGRVLLVSTDPAPSIGDALGITDSQWARRATAPVPNVDRLDVWQMDATSAFEELRDRYRDRIDEVFDALVGRGLDVAHDRAILRELLSLAPPGIDELYAMSALGETLAENRYEWLVVDPAPTGHLLRLLEMPAVALEWSHRLMRLILKYREVGGLGEAAQELVSFSRRTRALDQLLHDESRAGMVLVTLDEPIVHTESVRLADAVRANGIAVTALVVNRLRDSHVPAAPAWAPRTILALESPRPLVGVGTIFDWCCRWQARN